MGEIIHKNTGIKMLIEFHPDSIEEYGRDPKDKRNVMFIWINYLPLKITQEKELIKPVISTTTAHNKQTLTIDKFIDLANKDTINLFCQTTIT